MFERYSESGRRALFFARYESSNRGSLAIEPEHLLSGLLRERKGVLPRVLQELKASPEALEQEYGRLATFREKGPTAVEIPFSRPVKAALNFAVEEADSLGHSYIGPEHLMLGLLRQEGTLASSILTGHGLRVNEVRATIVRVLAQAAQTTSGSLADAAALAHQIKRWVDELAGVRAGSPQAEALAHRIHAAVDALTRTLHE